MVERRDPRTGSYLELSDRTKLRLTGLDRIRFINGQITNDIRKASSSAAIAACVLNPKGKLNAHLYLSAQNDAILIDADAALNESLGSRLERYIIADDVQLEDVTDQFSLLHVLGAEVPLTEPMVIQVNRFGQAGFDIWVELSRSDAVIDSLSANLPGCDQDCAEVLRIEQGIPRWGAELTGEIIPVEANLEESCIDYAKGCYIGQEVISRMKMSGQRNKSLCGIMPVDDVALQPGAKLTATDADQKEIGWITSAIFSDRLGKHIALGYVKRPFNTPGSEAMARDKSAVPVRIVDLPFSPK
jgi:folate-binding protein YgfZ